MFLRPDMPAVVESAALHRPGFTGVVVWGLHRDTAELRKIGLPLYSYGAAPPPPATAGPTAPSCSAPPNSARR